MPENKSHERVIWVDSVYGSETRLPLVQLSFGETFLQISPAEARELAGNIFQAAEAAEQEGFLVTFMNRISGGTLTQAQMGGILMEFRGFREEGRGG